ncbi:MAG: ferritin-like domain-containing protein [Synergistaceae bacterium]|nr:ferritin-like domain-containing protein [Synergistaceae bacterium]
MSYYEPYSELSDAAREFDRVIQSLVEELDAINLYNQRADVTKDESVRALTLHNRNEEIEHAVMLFEWLRRSTPEFDAQMKTYLFTSPPITEVEEIATGGAGAADQAESAGSGSLGIGSLKK